MAYRRTSARRGRAGSTRRSYAGARGRSTRKTARRSSRSGTRKSAGAKQTLRIVIEHAAPNEMARPAGIGTVAKTKKTSKF